jgi:peptidyl-prolyl cis-trans isomerase D
MRIDDRTYNEKEFRLLGSSAYELTTSLARYGDYDLIQLIMALSSGAGAQQRDPSESFFIGRMIVRDAKEEFGVHPGEEEISDYLRTLRVFTGPDGAFSAEAYRTFIERGMGRLGMTEKDLRNLASDILAAKQINAIVGSGLGVNSDIIAKSLALDNQLITGELARLEMAPFEEAIQPTEEDIKAHWEIISDSFTTEPLRKFTYVVATPVLPEEASDAIPEAPETLADAAASDEARAAAEKKRDELRAANATKLAEERRKKQMELDSLVDDFLFKLEGQKGSGFEELAAANGWEVKTTELFGRSASPAELDVELRSSTRGGKAIDELFRIQETADPFSKISEAIAIGENQWIVARLDGEELSRTKTYEEARDDARAQYISEKAAEALKTAAQEAVTQIETLMAADKSFAEAAAAAGIAETREFSAITSTYRPDGAFEPQNLFEAIRNVDPGSIAEVITESDRAFIVHVAKREVVKEENMAARIESEINSRANDNEMIAFVSWINARTEAAKVELLYNR